MASQNGTPTSNGNGNGNKQRKVVYTIIETGEGKSFWRQVGAAFVNRDESLTVLLDALPVNGRLHIREYSERDERKAS
ncbi:MAG: hypothetical protein ABIJ09_18780 [Pseudomonadota bacterium]